MPEAPRDDANDDVRQRMMNLVRDLDPEQLSRVHHAILDALISAARGIPSHYAINETVDMSQGEARRICNKIGLDWMTGRMDPEQ